MNLYLMEGVSCVSVAYHDGGSILVAADTPERALEMAPVLTEDSPDLDAVRAERSTAIKCIGTTDLPEQVWVFPDAGCC
jgi:hypothetical protein